MQLHVGSEPYMSEAQPLCLLVSYMGSKTAIQDWLEIFKSPTLILMRWLRYDSKFYISIIISKSILYKSLEL